MSGDAVIEQKVTFAEEKKIVNFTVKVSEGIDPWNLEEITLVDVKAFSNSLLSTVHRELSIKLHIDWDDPQLFYTFENEKEDLFISNTLSGLNIKSGSVIVLSTSKKRKRSKKTKAQKEFITIICSTRIGVTHGDSIKQIRVLIYPRRECKLMMDGVANHLGKTGLKFRCGRTVLKEEKTFEDQGVVDGSEIVVTGGRG